MTLQNSEKRIILASGSKGRGDILRGTGLVFEQMVADVDERALQAKLFEDDPMTKPAIVAAELGKAKAIDVSVKNPDAYVIGGDQVLDFDNRLFEKPKNKQESRENLLAFRGHSHFLKSAICVAKNGEIIWDHVATAQMKMRDFSDEFLDEYLEIAGDSVLTSVGVYRLEETGIHLFDSIEGDYFTILGLPILPLLTFLREEGLIKS